MRRTASRWRAVVLIRRKRIGRVPKSARDRAGKDGNWEEESPMDRREDARTGKRKERSREEKKKGRKKDGVKGTNKAWKE